MITTFFDILTNERRSVQKTLMYVGTCLEKWQKAIVYVCNARAYIGMISGSGRQGLGA
jgi:hypothetical protein